MRTRTIISWLSLICSPSSSSPPSPIVLASLLFLLPQDSKDSRP